MSFTVYRSSAGSGKTYTLVKAYLRIALGSERTEAYRNILAITFTNKAANEMKERVIKAMQALGGKEPPTGGHAQLLVQLCSELSLPEEVLQERASKVLESLLHNYSDFSVSTIDKFIHRVVRTFAHDLDIPYNFEVELDASNLLSKAIDLLISRIGDDPQLTRALVEFTESKADDEKSWHIEADLYKFASTLLTEDGHSHLERIRTMSIEDFFTVRDELKEEIAAFEETMSSWGKEALDAIFDAGISESAFAGGSRTGIPAYFRYLEKVRADKLEPSNTLLANIEAGKWYSGKASATDKHAIDMLRPTLEELFHQSVNFLDEKLGDYHLHVLIFRNIYALAVLNELEKIITDFKAENNLLHISEFNKRIADIVAWEPAPFIYERLGERYHHYLIDEFQDTSVLQWQNLLPLVENALSAGHFNMVVGDGKQSIYRWRGGEVEQFANLPKVFNATENPFVKDRERVLIQHFKEEKLNTNYRSRSEVVEFNNFFFERISQNLDERFQPIYTDVKQEFRKDHHGGLVRVDILEPQEDQDEQEVNFARILACITECREDGYALNEITVLCRRNNEASLIAQFLLTKGIDVISSESLMLANSESVRFLVAFIRYLSDTANRVFQAELLIQFDRAGLLREKLHTCLARLNEESSSFSFREFISRQGFEADPAQLNRLPLYEMTEELTRRFGLNATVSPYINFFLDFVFTYSARQNDNLGEFIEKWEVKKRKLSIVIPEGIEAVQIMTIHKSKGLEFPVVIFPFANWRVKNAKNDLWIAQPGEDLRLETALVPASKELEKTAFKGLYTEESNKSLLDNINVLYVACTRAVDRFYMLTSEPGRMYNLSALFLAFLKDDGGWNEELNYYQLGERHPHKAEKDTTPAPTAEALSTMRSQDWRSKVMVSLKAPEMWDFEHPDPSGLMQLLHTAFLNLPDRGKIKRTVRNMFLEGLLIESEGERLEAWMTELTDREDVSPFFAEGLDIRHDAEFLLPDGDSYQPERLIVKGKEAQLLTFLMAPPTSKQIAQLGWAGTVLVQMGYRLTGNYFLDLNRGTLHAVNQVGSGQLSLFG